MQNEQIEKLSFLAQMTVHFFLGFFGYGSKQAQMAAQKIISQESQKGENFN